MLLTVVGDSWKGHAFMEEMRRFPTGMGVRRAVDRASCSRSDTRLHMTESWLGRRVFTGQSSWQVVSGQWPQQVINTLASYSYGCELDAITAAAIAACDGLDGVADGIVGEVDACLDSFDPLTLVATIVDQCPQAPSRASVLISQAAAIVASETWKGPVGNGHRRLWYGLSPGADLTGNDPAYQPGPDGFAFTNCSATGKCTGNSKSSFPWFQLFIAKDPSFDVRNLTDQQFFDMAHAGTQQYASILGTDDPEMSRFRDSGGKMITFHGLVSSYSSTCFVCTLSFAKCGYPV